MRMTPMIMVMFIMYIMIGIYHQTIGPTGQISGDSGSFLFNIIIQPWNWSGTTGSIPNLLLLLGGIFGISVGAVVAMSFISKSDIATLSPIFLAIVVAGAPPILSLYNFVVSEMGYYVCTVGEECGPANILGWLTAGILALYWIFTCLQWWTWRETT